MNLGEMIMANEKRDITLKAMVSATEWAAIKSRRDAIGLSESAYLRLLALTDVSNASRQQIYREHDFPVSTANGHD